MGSSGEMRGTGASGVGVARVAAHAINEGR